MSWLFLVVGLFAWAALLAVCWPRESAAALARKAGRVAATQVAIYLVGLSWRQAWLLFVAAAGITGCLVAGLTPVLSAAGFEPFETDNIELTMFAISGIFAAVFVPLQRLRSRATARLPFVTVTANGISTPEVGAVAWGEILNFYSGSGNSLIPGSTALYFEARASASGPQRFVPLCRGDSKTSFLVEFPSDRASELSWSEVTQELEWRRNKGADLRPVPAAGNASLLSIVQSGQASELVLPHSIVRRVLFVLLGATLAALVAAPWAYWISTSPEDFKDIPLLLVLGLAILGLVSLDLIYMSLRWVIGGLTSRNLLVVNSTGLHHCRLGFIHWEDVHRVAIFEFTSQSDEGQEQVSLWLGAQVTEPAYRRARRSLGLVERLWVSSTLRKTKTKSVLLLVSMAASGTDPYLVNGVAMPGESGETIAGFINGMKPKVNTPRRGPPLP